jgi:hypothetical protein
MGVKARLSTCAFGHIVQVENNTEQRATVKGFNVEPILIRNLIVSVK